MNKKRSQGGTDGQFILINKANKNRLQSLIEDKSLSCEDLTLIFNTVQPAPIIYPVEGLVVCKVYREPYSRVAKYVPLCDFPVKLPSDVK